MKDLTAVEKWILARLRRATEKGIKPTEVTILPPSMFNNVKVREKASRALRSLEKRGLAKSVNWLHAERYWEAV